MVVELAIGILLLIAAFIDIKTREVPNFLSYGLLALVSFHVLYTSIIEKNFSIILYSLLGLLVAGALGYLLYRLGQWGGGDVKLVFSLGLFYGLRLEVFPELLLFLVATFLIGGIIGIAYSVFIALKHARTFKKNAGKFLRMKEVNTVRKIITFSVLIVLFITFFIQSVYTYMLLGIAFMVWVGFFLWLLIKSVEDIIMIKERAVDKLVEGDWLLKPLKAKGLEVKPREIGLTKQDLEKIMKMGLKKVTIKEGLPFVPSFFIGYVLTFYSHLWFPFQ